MLPSAPLWFALVCAISLSDSHTITGPSVSPSKVSNGINTPFKRGWESDQGPFSLGPPDRLDDATDTVNIHQDEPGHGRDEVSGSDEKIGIPNPISILASIIGGARNGASGMTLPGNPTQPGVPTSTAGSGGGLLGSVVSILVGGPSVTPLPNNPSPGNSGGNDAPLGGLLSVLSQVVPVSESLPTPAITAPPTIATDTSGLLAQLGVLNGVASALNGVLGSSDGGNGGGSGLLGQLSANIIGPIASIAADPVSLLANPTAAINDLQNQVSAILDSVPSAVAVGVQLASNVGGDLADALNATNDVLNNVPDVAGGVADQVGSLLNAVPDLATGLPAAALSAVSQVESVLTAVPDLDGTVTGLLSELKNNISSVAANAIPEVSSLAGAIGSQVVGILPSALQPLVSGVLSTLQNSASGLLCQVSETVGGTAVIFGVPCGQASSTATLGIGSALTAPATVSASATLTESLSLITTPTSSALPQLASVLSSLSSSILSSPVTIPPPGASTIAPIANSALSGLSSLISQISGLSLTATNTPSSLLTMPSSSIPETSNIETTILQVQTITALITSTSVQTIVVTECPSVFTSYTPPASPTWTQGPSGSGSNTSPCPGQGYTCDDCLDGWFCPPIQTPALPAPCGTGWPCLHCDNGWFCIPSPQFTDAAVLESSPTQNAVVPKAYSTINGYRYVGCYEDNPGRALRDAHTSSLAGGMTNDQCIDFCQTQGFLISGTEYGTQCFCGNILLDSIIMSNGRCNTTCEGDVTNSTMCGGSWALSIWSPGGSMQQGQSVENNFTLATDHSGQNIGGIGYSKIEVASSTYAWPGTPSRAGTTATPSVSIGVPELEAAMLSAVVLEVHEIQLPSAADIISSVSSVFNMGMSSIARDLSLTASVESTTFIMRPTNIPLGPGPVILSTPIPTTVTIMVAASEVRGPTVVTVETGDMDTKSTTDIRGAAEEGNFVSVASNRAGIDESHMFPKTLSRIKRERRTSRRRSHWA